jgi:hypothetical protein
MSSSSIIMNYCIKTYKRVDIKIDVTLEYYK